MKVDEFKEEFPGIIPENPTTNINYNVDDIRTEAENIRKQLNDNIDRPDRHNINPANRPVRNEDPLSPRNLEHRVDTHSAELYPMDEGDRPLTEHEETMVAVEGVLTNIASLLKAKNKKYGNSALEPMRIFSSANSVEQIKVRIDDKLSRISKQHNSDDEDVLQDLIGYLVLLTIANDRM